jgi:hypothetical protein
VETNNGQSFSFLLLISILAPLHIYVDFSRLDFKFHVIFWIVEVMLCVFII